MNVADVLPVVLGAGGAGFIAALAQAWNAWRYGAEARESKAIANLERWRDEADARAVRYMRELERERKWGNYWCSWSASLERRLILNGVELPERPAEPERPPAEGA